MRLFLLSSMCGICFAQSIFQIAATSVSYTLQPIATGTSVATLVPFDIDFISLPGYQSNNTVFDQVLNSTWTTEVVVLDDTNNYDSFLSLSWPDGEGPGTKPVGHNNTWNACLIALPTLLEQLEISDTGNGTCIDIIESKCVYRILSTILSSWDDMMNERDPSLPALQGACQWASNNIRQSSECFGTSTDYNKHIQGYWTTSPTNGEPFLLGVQAYNASGSASAKSEIRTSVVNKVWPLVILEAEGNYSVQATMTCPHAGNISVSH